jgi:hypothetical protein
LEVFHCTFLVASVSWNWPSGSRLNPEVQCHRLSLEQDEREAFYCGTPKQQQLFKSQTKDSHGTPVGHAYTYPPIRYSNSEQVCKAVSLALTWIQHDTAACLETLFTQCPFRMSWCDVANDHAYAYLRLRSHLFCLKRYSLPWNSSAVPHSEEPEGGYNQALRCKCQTLMQLSNCIELKSYCQKIGGCFVNQNVEARLTDEFSKWATVKWFSSVAMRPAWYQSLTAKKAHVYIHIPVYIHIHIFHDIPILLFHFSGLQSFRSWKVGVPLPGCSSSRSLDF